jgi:hypothetical protein
MDGAIYRVLVFSKTQGGFLGGRRDNVFMIPLRTVRRIRIPIRWFSIARLSLDCAIWHSWRRAELRKLRGLSAEKSQILR